MELAVADLPAPVRESLENIHKAWPLNAVTTSAIGECEQAVAANIGSHQPHEEARPRRNQQELLEVCDE